MTITPNDPTTTLPGRPPVVDMDTWRTAREALLVREKAHTREGDALAAARRRLPMVELDGTVEVVGPEGPVPFLNLFEGRDELVVYKHMWHDGAPHQGQCEGCTTVAWHLKDAVYLNARGVSLAILTTGRWDEVALFHDGPRHRAGQRLLRPGRQDALRPGRGVGGQPRGVARRARRLLVLALGRGGERHLGPDQPPRAPVDPSRRDRRRVPRSARPPSLRREPHLGAARPAADRLLRGRDQHPVAAGRELTLAPVAVRWREVVAVG